MAISNQQVKAKSNSKKRKTFSFYRIQLCFQLGLMHYRNKENHKSPKSEVYHHHGYYSIFLLGYFYHQYDISILVFYCMYYSSSSRSHPTSPKLNTTQTSTNMLCPFQKAKLRTQKEIWRN